MGVAADAPNRKIVFCAFSRRGCTQLIDRKRSTNRPATFRFPNPPPRCTLAFYARISKSSQGLKFQNAHPPGGHDGRVRHYPFVEGHRAIINAGSFRISVGDPFRAHNACWSAMNICRCGAVRRSGEFSTHSPLPRRRLRVGGLRSFVRIRRFQNGITPVEPQRYPGHQFNILALPGATATAHRTDGHRTPARRDQQPVSKRRSPRSPHIPSRSLGSLHEVGHRICTGMKPKR